LRATTAFLQQFLLIRRRHAQCSSHRVMVADRCAWIAGLALLAACGGNVDRAPARAALSFSIAQPRVEERATTAVLPTAAPELTPPATPAAPTWSQIYERHLAAGTAGGCGRSAACHQGPMSDATTAYSWLQQRGYIDGTRSAIVRPNSCLRWFGGNMPPRGTDDPGAVADLSAWVAAGAPEN
jgi:hypothetical protein